MFTPEELTTIALSVRVASVAALASLPVAVAVGWLLARKRFPASLLDALVHLPWLPPVVVGYALLVAFGSQGPVGRFLGEFGIELAFRWTGAALAAGIMGFPLMVRTIRLSIENVDRRLEQAAATLGASPWRRFFTITLPLAAGVWRARCWASPRRWASWRHDHLVSAILARPARSPRRSRLMQPVARRRSGGWRRWRW